MDTGNTEIKIKEAARKVFLKKGMAGARMQEIADEAGINKALLHYYYRNKELLFQSIFEDALKEFLPQLVPIIKSEVPLEVKVYQFADKYISFLAGHQELPLFIIHEIQSNPERLMKSIQKSNVPDLSILSNQLRAEIESGRFSPISIEDFLMNIISMLVFPFIAKVIFRGVTQMNEEDYLSFLERRKTEVPKFILDALRP